MKFSEKIEAGTAALESSGTIFNEFRSPKDIYLLLQSHRKRNFAVRIRLLSIQAIYSMKFSVK